MTTRAVVQGQRGGSPEEFLQQLEQGGALLASGRTAEALPHLEAAHALQPRNDKAQNLLGLCCFKLGHLDRAAEIYELLVRDNPVDATLRVNLGLVYLKANSLQRAVREFETATDLSPDHRKAHNYLGLALAQAGEYGRAREHFVLAGSDHMAEKMARALDGAGYANTGTPSGGIAAVGSLPVSMVPPESSTGSALPPDEVIHAGTQTAFDAVAHEVETDFDEEHGAGAADAGTHEATAHLPPQPAEDWQSGGPGDWVGPGDDAPTEGAESWASEEGHDVPTQGPESWASDEAPVAPTEGSESWSPDEGHDAMGPDDVGSAPPNLARLDDSWGAQFGLEDEAEPVTANATATAMEDAAEELVVELHTDDEEAQLQGEASAPTGEAELDFGSLDEDASPEGVLPPADPIAHAWGPPGSPEASEAADWGGGEGPEDQPAATAPGWQEAPETAPAWQEEPELAAPAPAWQEPEEAGSEESWVAFEEPGEAPPPPSVADDGWEEPAFEPAPSDAEGRHPSAPGNHPGSPPPLTGTWLAELSRALLLSTGPEGELFSVAPDGVATLQIHGELRTRTHGFLALEGDVSLTPEPRRKRGRASGQMFGPSGRELMRARGRGLLHVRVPDRRLVPLELGEEGVYLCEHATYAFEDSVMFENGSLGDGDGGELLLVHLRGAGRVLVELQGDLRSVAVRTDAPATVPLSRLVGWLGEVEPRLVSAGTGIGARVELRGDGFALLDVAPREGAS